MKKILLLRGNNLLDHWRQQHFSEETRNRKAECKQPVKKKKRTGGDEQKSEVNTKY